MDEHDDDLESTVLEGAEEETESYPNTGDELNREPESQGDVTDEPNLDKDRSEL
jgi:hypothetical protein